MKLILILILGHQVNFPCGSAAHYMPWHQWGCQRWLLVSGRTWVFAAVNMNCPYSEEPACQRRIREGLCSSDGDTEDRDMLERLRYWILLPDSWVTFRLSRRMRQRWISQSSGLLSTAPPTGLRINAPFYPCAQQGDPSWTASPSIEVQQGATQEKVAILIWSWVIKGELSELGSCLVHLHCNSWREGLGTVLNLAASGQFKKEGSHPHSKLHPVLPDALFPSLHLRRSVHKYMQHDWARSHANALNTNENEPALFFFFGAAGQNLQFPILFL